MALVSYVFTEQFGTNNEGDVIHLDPDDPKTQNYVDAGLLKEASADDVNKPDDEAAEGEAPAEQEAAITRAIANGFQDLKASLAKTAAAPAKKTAGFNIGNHAVPKEPVFKNISDLVKAIYKSRENQTARNQLTAYQQELRRKSPVGMSEGTNSAGGYTVIPTWADEIFSKVKNYPRLLDMTNRQTISGSTLNIPAVNETSLADGSRGGGILRYWVSEGSAVTTSYPAFTQVQAVINTVAVIVPISNQLLEDNAYNLQQFLAEKVGEEFVFGEDYDVIQGSGSSQPKGILNQASLISVAKESGQSAATIVFPNLAKMWARLYPPSRVNAVWLCNPQVYQQLVQMTFPNASGTYPAFGGLTFNAHDEFQLRAFGKPVIECLMTADLGNVGDLLLVDLKQLTCAEKAGMDVAVSDQVYFTSLQTLFRFVRRYDLQSPWTAALTDFNSHYTYSPFIALQGRGT